MPLPGQEPTGFLNTASADYFRTLRIPLQRGRSTLASIARMRHLSR